MSEEQPIASKGISGVERAMVMMAIGVLIAPGIHAIAKGLGDTIAPAQVAFARFFFQLLLLLPLVLLFGGGKIATPSIAHILRGMLLALATLSFFWALTYMPMADSAAIFFVEPLILTILSAIFLGEPIGSRRIIAVVAGFIGAMVVIRPSFQSVGLPAILPLLAALFFAIYLIITRKMTKFEDARMMQFWVCVFGSITLLLAMMVGIHQSWAVLIPSWPNRLEWGLLLLLGGIATISHMLAINAIRQAPAGILAPFQYLEILGAMFLGALFFGELPDGVTMLGILIIVSAGLYVFYRERQIVRQSGDR